jgi:hypothetical protein
MIPAALRCVLSKQRSACGVPYVDPHETRPGDRQAGFPARYERQLYEGHAYLVTGLLPLIMMAIALEVVQFRDSRLELVVLPGIGAIGGCILHIRCRAAGTAGASSRRFDAAPQYGGAPQWTFGGGPTREWLGLAAVFTLKTK